MRKVYSMNEAWKVKRAEEITKSVQKDFFDSYRGNGKTGLIVGPMASSFYDDNWDTVTLPHDWAISELPEESMSRGNGYRPKGVVVYRKYFLAEKEWQGKRIFLKFDGVATTCEIYFNDIKIACLETGYTPINVEITDFIYFDRNNTVAVKADSTLSEGWWYEGGGIYRNVYLMVKEKNHFENDGVFVSAKKKTSDVWEVSVSAETVTEENCQVEVLMEGRGIVKTVDAQKKTSLSFDFSSPVLWDDENPFLYNITVNLKKDGIVCDNEEIRFGFREFSFDVDRGFVINGKSKKLKGVCLHHDHGGVGVALDKNIIEYRMKKLKEMGCNAVRTSHNPQNPEFYAVCDELGFYIMNETRHFSSTEIILGDLEAFVRRDRNHPCVVLWSLFNEEPLQCTEMGERIISSMIKRVHKFDTTRPITGGMNGPIESNGAVKYVDVMGFNYLQYGYDEFHKLHPTIPIVGSETGSYMSSRDEYVTDRKRAKVSCYKKVMGENFFHWSDTPGGTWKYIAERTFVAGGFYWTGIDYYGEAIPVWPGITSNFGAMDVCGFEKECFFWHKALWSNEPVLEIPRAWYGKANEPIDLICYSNCDTVEIIVNGKSLGEKANDVFSHEVITVPYEEGKIEAIGKKDGKVVCEKKIFSLGKKHSLEIDLIKENVNIGENAVCNIYLKDEYGQIVKNEFSEVVLNVSGGKIVGSSNGENTNQFAKADRHPLFHGCAQFIVRPIEQTVLVEAECKGLKASAKIKADFDESIKIIPSAEYKSYANHFMMSDVHSEYPDKKKIPDIMFTWIPTAINNEKSLMMSGKTGYAVLRCVVASLALKENVCLTVEGIRGDFDIYICGEKIYSSNGEYSGDVKILCNELKNEETPSIQVVFKLNGKECGISGNIFCS